VTYPPGGVTLPRAMLGSLTRKPLTTSKQSSYWMCIRKQQKAELFADVGRINGKIVLQFTSCDVFLNLQQKTLNYHQGC